MIFAGIDVGKTDLHVAILEADRIVSKKVNNAPAGFRQLASWFKNRRAIEIHVCLEATGGWSEQVATYLHSAGMKVSIVNPSRIKAFAQSELLRTKTDRVDAALIARFCRAHCPLPWAPTAPESLELQGLVRRRWALVHARTEERNRLSSPITSAIVRDSVDTMLKHIANEIVRIESAIEALLTSFPELLKQRALLTSIPGIADTTAAIILAEMPNLRAYRNVKAVAAFAGLSPRHFESGSAKWRSRLAKTGNSDLRQALYFPAIVAMRHNPLLRAFSERLRANGKSNMTIIAAVMRKLLTHCYGILRSAMPFDANYVSA